MQKKSRPGFFLITGFLGSGKTTFLKHILSTIGEKHRIAIIQNELAPAGIDSKDLRNTGVDFNLTEINNGSVFCICQLSTFITVLNEIIEKHNPEMIFLEASGLSDPVNILEILQHESLQGKLILQSIIAIADASFFFRGMSMLQRFSRQLMIADIVIINKTDLNIKMIVQIDNTIRNLNPFANIIRTNYCQIPFSEITGYEKADHKAATSFKGTKSQGRPEINTFVLRTHDKISVPDLNDLISELAPDCTRIKGFICTTEGKVIALQTIFDQVEMKEIPDLFTSTEIIAFSKKLNARDFTEKFKGKSDRGRGK